MSERLRSQADEYERMAEQLSGQIGRSLLVEAAYYRAMAKQRPSDQTTAIKLMIEYRKQGVKMTAKQARKMMGEIRQDVLASVRPN